MPKLRTALLSVLLAAAPPARAQLIVSEVLADPSSLPDAAGEFVEIADAGDRPESADSVRLVVDGDTLPLGAVSLPPGGHLLLCRDSAVFTAAAGPGGPAGGPGCGRSLPRLSLANSRPLAMALLWGSFRSAFEVPAAKPGVSWENTWDDERGLRDFARSAAAFLEGDSATPGFRNSRSRRRARRDLALARIALGPDGGTLEAVIADRGSEAVPGILRVRADTDWDGIAETPVDSAGVPAGGGVARMALGPDHAGILEAVLGGDEDPADNRATLYRGTGATLAITEAAAAPEAGPEWAEIRNATGDGGGWPRALDLARVTWNGIPLGPEAGRLQPGEYLLLAEDAAALKARLGPLKVRIHQVPSWRALRNTGDTCRLGLAGAVLDSLAYGSRDAGAGASLARPAGPGSPAVRPAAAETPGWQARPASAALSMRLSARVLDRSRPAGIHVEAPAGAAFALRVYDLEGACRRTLGRGGEGSHAFAWAGEGELGKPLPPGPYILCLSAGGHAPVRKVVAVADPP